MALSGFESLVVENLAFAYGRDAAARAVGGVSFRCVGGERVAIVGPNGCGKSTLLRLMLGEMRPLEGSVRVNGKLPWEIGRIGMARLMAMVPQIGSGAGSGGLGGGGFTVRQMVLMARFAAHAQGAGLIGSLVSSTAGGMETEEDLRLADVAMWNCDVHHLAGRAVETLSGGERQRVAIARAYAQETPVLLLDEPTSALDLFHQLELLAQVEEMAGGSAGSAAAGARRLVVMVTHDLNLALRFATRVILMDMGKVVADGAPSEVLTAEKLEGVYRVKVKNEGGGLKFERGMR